VYRKSLADQECSIARALDVVGEWWTLLILRDAFRGVHRFDDFLSSLGIARNVLAVRLAKLVEHGLLERRPVTGHAGRHEYRLTAKGRDLQPVLLGLLRWGDRWAAPDGEPPVVLAHTGCGHDADPRLVCGHCGGELHPGNVRRRGSEAVAAG
jgi:DNA-binding HxlR family transcriptional regulator